MSEVNLFELIEQYYEGKLSPEETSSFEKRMESDEVLIKKIQIYKASRKLVIQNRLLEVKHLLIEERRKEGSKGGKLITGIIVFFILAAGLTYIFFPFQNKKRGQPKEHDVVEKTVKGKQSQGSPEEVIAPKTVLKHQKTVKIAPDVKTKIVEIDSTDTKEVQKKEVLVTYAQDSTPQELPVETNPTVSQIAPEVEKTLPCLKIKILASITPSPACFGEANGTLGISEISGGQAPYVFQLDEEKSKTAFFNNLKAGNYTLSIEDLNGCKSVFKGVTIAEKACRKNYSFNPFYGQKWQVPVYDKSGILSIFDKMGKRCFEKDIPGGEQVEWTGQSTRGTLTAGYYLFIIKYEDGSLIQGSVTIVQ